MPFRSFFAAPWVALSLVAAGCRSEVSLPVVVLVTLDTTRADHLSTYGYERKTSPRLDELAEQALVFDRAIATESWTLPSHASMFTGLDPAEHGCFTHTDDSVDVGGVNPALSSELPSLTRRLSDAGYYLVGATANTFLSREFGFAANFDDYIDEHPHSRGRDLNPFIFDALDARPADKPLFLFVNYVDAHAPYDPPGDLDYSFEVKDEDLPEIIVNFVANQLAEERTPLQIRQTVDQYDRELWLQDLALGELFDGLRERGLAEDSLWIITSDHGEFLGEGQMFGHGYPPFEEVVRVPLVIYRERNGVPVLSGRDERPVSLTNIPQTVLAQLGLPGLADNEGRFDLLALPDELPPVYVEHRSLDTWIGVLVSEDVKYGEVFEAPALQFDEFVMESGDVPWGRVSEVDSLGSEELEDARDYMRELVEDWEPAPEELVVPELGQEHLDDLKAFGYAGD